jgi:hypothetical protein
MVHLVGPVVLNCHFVVSQKGGGLLMLRGFSENRWQPLIVFLLKILDNVSSSGSSAGIAASSHSRSAMERNKVSDLYDYFNNLFFNNFGKFCTPPPPTIRNILKVKCVHQIVFVSCEPHFRELVCVEHKVGFTTFV